MKKCGYPLLDSRQVTRQHWISRMVLCVNDNTIVKNRDASQMDISTPSPRSEGLILLHRRLLNDSRGKECGHGFIIDCLGRKKNDQLGPNDLISMSFETACRVHVLSSHGHICVFTHKLEQLLTMITSVIDCQICTNMMSLCRWGHSC